MKTHASGTRKDKKVSEAKKETETQYQRIGRVKAQVAAEKEREIENKIKVAKKAGLSAKAVELYTKAWWRSEGERCQQGKVYEGSKDRRR